MFNVRELKTIAMSEDQKAINQDSLPFRPTPSASIVGRTTQDPVYKRRFESSRLPAEAMLG